VTADSAYTASLLRQIDGGIGHNLPQEAPQAFAQAVVDVDERQVNSPRCS
jgi:hypothetical protein